MRPILVVLALMAPFGAALAADTTGVRSPTIGGDFRLRHESNFDLANAPNRHRERVRLRAQAEFRVTEEVGVGARLSTGNRQDPNSPHQTLGGLFDRFEVGLDRAFVRYRPRWAPALEAEAGKFSHGFVRNPVYGELVWDDDVQPEGAAQRLVWRRREGRGEVGLRVGEYLVLERGAGGDVGLFAVQAHARCAPLAALELQVAVAHYHYTELTPDGAAAVLSRNRGNAVAGGDFASAFGIWHPLAVATWTMGAARLTLAGDYVWNARAAGDEDRGGALGLRLDRGRLGGYYQWQQIERDAVLTPFAQDDLLHASGFQGHVFGGEIALANHARLHLWSLASRRLGDPAPGSDRLQWRSRADLNLSY